MHTESQKNGQLIVIGGIVVALIGFFLIPFVTISTINTQTQSQSQTQTQISSYAYSALQAASLQGFIWLDALLAVGILLVALLLAFKRNPFDMSRVPREKQFYAIGMLIAISGEIYALRMAQPARVVPVSAMSPNMLSAQGTPLPWQQPPPPYQQDWQQPNQQPPQYPSQSAQEQYPPQQAWRPPQPPIDYQ